MRANAEEEQEIVAARSPPAGRSTLLSFAQAVETFLGDVTYMEPRLLAMYDDALPRVDRALSGSGKDRPR